MAVKKVAKKPTAATKATPQKSTAIPRWKKVMNAAQEKQKAVPATPATSKTQQATDKATAKTKKTVAAPAAKPTAETTKRAEQIMKNDLVLVTPSDEKLTLENEPHSAVKVEGLMEYEVPGSPLRLLGMVDPAATPTTEQRFAIAKRLLEVGPKLPRYVKTIEPKLPDFHNAEIMAQREASGTTKKDAATKAPKAASDDSTVAAPALTDGVPLKKICADIELDPKLARRILRAKGKKPGGRWEWKKDEVEAIKKLLKEEAAKL